MTAAAVSQRVEALERANHVRLARAQCKRDVHAGTLTIPDAMGLECCRSMLLANLLREQPRWGMVRTRRLLRAAMIGESTRVDALTDRQRLAVIELLGDTA